MPAAARAFWVTAPGVGEIRRTRVPEPGPDDVLVRTVRSAVSRGTETLVFRGRVPVGQRVSMRAPFQDGEFPGPVKYGYLNVGVVEQGPTPLLGRTVFCLYPHQSTYVVPARAVVAVPEGVPAERAVLAGTVETALNALWDAPPLLGDRVAVVGAGMVGCCVARLATQVPGARVTLVDVDPGRAEVADALHVDFALAGTDGMDGMDGMAGMDGMVGMAGMDGRNSVAGLPDQDLVVHTTASSAGLQTALDLLAPDTAVLDLSWYGDGDVQLSLGGRFHTARLGIRASQVGTVAPSRRGRRTPADRLALALELLRDPVFDVILTGTSPLADLPDLMTRLADGDRSGICHSVSYETPVTSETAETPQTSDA
ncbi:MAG: zinc-binding alcohol dehydrogenase [Lapillicoccus sp.]